MMMKINVLDYLSKEMEEDKDVAWKKRKLEEQRNIWGDGKDAWTIVPLSAS